MEIQARDTPGMLAMAQIEFDLADLLGGRCVDLRTAAELSRHFRDDVVRTARTLYAAQRS